MRDSTFNGDTFTDQRETRSGSRIHGRETLHWIVLFAHVLRRIRRERSRFVSVWRSTIYRGRAFSRTTHLSDSLLCTRIVCQPLPPPPSIFHSLLAPLSSSWNFLIPSALDFTRPSIFISVDQLFFDIVV